MDPADLPPVYPIVDSAAWVTRLLPSGVRFIQLRIKQAAAAQLREEIAAARDRCIAFEAQLVVNDYWELALALNCDFVHLGQEDLASCDVPALRARGIRFGVSTHDEAELERALAARPDYIALGPIYPTLLKKMPWAPQGLSKLSDWRRRIGGIPLVAIGGLTPERLAGVFAAGADCAAVVTDIVRAAQPEQRMAQWLAEAARLTSRG